MLTEYESTLLDLPGHTSDDRWVEPTFKPGVEKIRDAIKANDTIAIGWSLGGNLLLSLALEKPEELKGIILVGCTSSYVKRNDFPYGQSKSMVRRMRMDLMADFHGTMERFYETNFSDLEKNNGDYQPYIESLRKTRESLNEDDMINALDALAKENLIDDISSINLPVLLVHGSSDMVCPVGASRYLMDRLPSVDLEIIEGAGHAPFLTRPKEFNKIVRRFIDKLKNDTTS